MKSAGISPLLLATLAVNMSANSSASTADRRPLLVSHCHAVDGDTLRCGSVRIRLVGIDAAELPGHCRQGRDCADGDPFEHKRALQGLAKGQLRITPIKLDKYSRLVANVETIDGRNVSCAIVHAGATYKREWDTHGHVRKSCPQATRR